MKILLMFLIVRLNTYDGLPNSIDKLKQKKYIHQEVTVRGMLQQIYKIYFLMKIRMKISFEACRSNKTIIELFLTAILKSYHERN